MRKKELILLIFLLFFMKEEERNTYGVFIGVLLLIIVPTIVLGFIGFGSLEYVAAILIILVIGLIFFGYNAFLK